MSETFEKILVKDDRLGCITPKVKFQVFKGGQNVTCQPYKAISETTANHVYNVTVPSLETIISREVLWQSTVTFRISNPNKSANDFAINYGVTDALAPFPLHSLVSVMSCTINNNTVNLNVQESLPLLLRMVDPEEFSKYDSMTPTALDVLANYEDAVKRQEFQIDATAANNAAPRPLVYYPCECRSGARRSAQLQRNPAVQLHIVPKQRPSLRHEPPSGNRLLPQAPRLLEGQQDLRKPRRAARTSNR